MNQALALVLEPSWRSDDRLRQLEDLESRLMGRLAYHRRELSRLTSGWGTEHAWEAPEEALVEHMLRQGQLERALEKVRGAL